MVYSIRPKAVHLDEDFGVQFEYFIAGQSRTFVVSRQALEDHFGLQVTGLAGQVLDAALGEAFMRGWERIRNVAARVRSAPAEHPVVLQSSDFPSELGRWPR